MNNFDQKEYQTVILGGLLHDIGKFLQRIAGADVNIKGTHEAIGAQFIVGQGPFCSSGNLQQMHLFSQQIQDKWVDKQLLKESVLKHHQGKAVCANIVHKADSYSTKERFETGDGVTTYPPRGKLTALSSVFGHIRFDKDRPIQQYWYNAHSLDSFQAIPAARKIKLEIDEADSLFEDFARELRGIRTSGRCFDHFFQTLCAVLEKYTWCLPCHTHPEVADVSIYDHLKSTSAIAACLYHFHSFHNTLQPKDIREDNIDKFLLVGGELSGIQKYIYQISSITGEGGVAKRLRARSFLVSALVEVTVVKILRALNLPVVCNFLSAGGHFVILAPNTEKAIKELEIQKLQISNWLLDHFSGELSLSLDWAIKLRGDDFYRRKDEQGRELWEETDRGKQERDPQIPRACNYRDKIDALRQNLKIRKLRRFDAVLQVDGCWNEPAFLRKQQYGDYKEGVSDCKSCRKFPATRCDLHQDISADSKQVLCDHCFTDKVIGGLLPNAEYLAVGQATKSERVNKESRRFYFYNDGYFVEPLADAAIDDYTDEFIVIQRLRDHRHEKKILPLGTVNRFLANYTPFFSPGQLDQCELCKANDDCDIKNRKTGVKPFQCIATAGCRPVKDNEAVCGSPLLGVLKADVDNLGLIFSQGLDNRITVSRYLTLSRMIDLFFSGWMYRILNEETLFKNIYTVYSGGDDLVMVGPWEAILVFAGRLNRDFKCFTCRNPDITLSAGIAVVHPQHPISDAVDSAERYLQKSKAAGKNRITVFDTTLAWNEFISHAEIVEIFDKGHKQFPEIFTTRFLHRLLEYHRMYCEARRGRLANLIFHARMHYDVERNLTQTMDTLRRKKDISPKEKAMAEWFKETIIQDILQAAPSDDRLMVTLKVPVCWTLYRNRTYPVRRKIDVA